MDRGNRGIREGVNVREGHVDYGGEMRKPGKSGKCASIYTSHVTDANKV